MTDQPFNSRLSNSLSLPLSPPLYISLFLSLERETESASSTMKLFVISINEYINSNSIRYCATAEWDRRLRWRYFVIIELIHYNENRACAQKEQNRHIWILYMVKYSVKWRKGTDRSVWIGSNFRFFIFSIYGVRSAYALIALNSLGVRLCSLFTSTLGRFY